MPYGAPATPYGAGILDIHKIEEQKAAALAQLTQQATNAEMQLTNAYTQRRQMIEGQAAHQLQATTAGIETTKVQQLTALDQQYHQQKLALEQSKAAQVMATEQRALQLANQAEQQRLQQEMMSKQAELAKSVPQMPMGSYVPSPFGVRY